MAQLLFSQNTSWRRDSAVWTVKVCGAGVVGSTPTASTNKGTWEMIITCTHCKEQIFEDYDFCTHCSRNETYYFCSKTCKYEWLLTTEVRVMPVLETPAVKNPFCRRSGRDKRSGRERRMSVDSAKSSIDRRSGVDRRKGQDRRKHDYWNTTVWWPEIGSWLWQGQRMV